MKVKKCEIYQHDIDLAEETSPPKHGQLWFKSSPKEGSTFSVSRLHERNCLW